MERKTRRMEMGCVGQGLSGGNEVAQSNGIIQDSLKKGLLTNV